MYYQVENTTVRLLGSMHRLPKSNPEVPAWVDEAYRWCEVLYIEHDFKAMLPLLRRTDGGSLGSELPKPTWSALQSRWPAHAAPIDALKPWTEIRSFPRTPS